MSQRLILGSILLTLLFFIMSSSLVQAQALTPQNLGPSSYLAVEDPAPEQASTNSTNGTTATSPTESPSLSATQSSTPTSSAASVSASPSTTSTGSNNTSSTTVKKSPAASIKVSPAAANLSGSIDTVSSELPTSPNSSGSDNSSGNLQPSPSLSAPPAAPNRPCLPNLRRCFPPTVISPICYGSYAQLFLPTILWPIIIPHCSPYGVICQEKTVQRPWFRWLRWPCFVVTPGFDSGIGDGPSSPQPTPSPSTSPSPQPTLSGSPSPRPTGSTSPSPQPSSGGGNSGGGDSGGTSPNGTINITINLGDRNKDVAGNARSTLYIYNNGTAPKQITEPAHRDQNGTWTATFTLKPDQSSYLCGEMVFQYTVGSNSYVSGYNQRYQAYTDRESSNGVVGVFYHHSGTNPQTGRGEGFDLIGSRDFCPDQFKQ